MDSRTLLMNVLYSHSLFYIFRGGARLVQRQLNPHLFNINTLNKKNPLPSLFTNLLN